MTKRASRPTSKPPPADTWIDDKGFERGVCLCGAETSTHPDDSQGGFARCPNCDVITCAACRCSDSGFCSRCCSKDQPCSRCEARQ